MTDLCAALRRLSPRTRLTSHEIGTLLLAAAEINSGEPRDIAIDRAIRGSLEVGFASEKFMRTLCEGAFA